MQSLRGSTLNPRPVSLVDMGLDDGDCDEQLEIGASSIAMGLKRSPINPLRESVPIAACDASSVKIGETDTGMIFAIRAVAVWRQPDRIAFTRWGPLLFHIPNSDGQQEKYRDDESRAFGGLSVKTLRVLTKLRNHVERWVQEELAITVKDGIVLLDGSLTAGTPDNPSSRVQRILSTARNNNSIIIALSKSTQLTVGGKNILGFFDAEKIPHIIDITSVVENEYPAYPIRFLGRVCVSKLSPDGFLTQTRPRNLIGYAGYSFSTTDVMSMMWGTFSASKKPRIFFPPTVSCVDLERAMTMLLLLRAVERIRWTLLEGLSGVPAVNDPSSSTIPFLTVTASSSWTQRST